jgi:single-stranded-DNA-specific exonuclease
MSLESKSNWVIPEKVSVDTLLEYILNRRDIENSEEFLNPQLENIPNFESLYDSISAAKKILEFAKEGKKIIIHGDFDADGISSVSILWEFLYNELSKYINKSIDVIPYIPSRVDQGYGLTKSSLNDLLELKADLVISVDCGVRDKELIREFRKEEGLEFVITDHHQPPEDILEDLDYTLVHPMYPKHEYPMQSVCGAYVTFLLVQAIRKESGMESNITPETPGLDLVALATVTDLMPLLSFNRTVVKYGLEQMRNKSRLGLVQLCNIASIDIPTLDSYHLGFVLGPRINAAGRIGSPLDAVKLLVSDKESVCKHIAEDLNETNFQRQYLTQNTLEQAEELVKEDSKLIFVVGKGWHEGIVGLVAGKLNEKYNRPVLVATESEEGIRGSARSITGFDITKTLSSCRKHLERFGGHEQAAGFSLKEENLKAFTKCIEKIAQEKITQEMLIKNINVDLLLSTEDIDYELINKLERLKPFGYKNSKPLIALTNLVVIKKQIMGKLGNHMKLVCKGEGIDLITLVLFGCDQDTETIQIDQVIDVIGGISLNTWNGNEQIQFQVKEWRYSNI